MPEHKCTEARFVLSEARASAFVTVIDSDKKSTDGLRADLSISKIVSGLFV